MIKTATIASTVYLQYTAEECEYSNRTLKTVHVGCPTNLPVKNQNCSNNIVGMGLK